MLPRSHVWRPVCSSRQALRRLLLLADLGGSSSSNTKDIKKTLLRRNQTEWVSRWTMTGTERSSVSWMKKKPLRTLSPRVLANLPVCSLVGPWLFLLALGLKLLLLVLSWLQQRRKMRRSRGPRRQMMTWDLACLIKFPLPCKESLFM